MMLPIINTCDGGGTDVVVVCGMQSILNSTGGGGSGGGVRNILNLTVPHSHAFGLEFVSQHMF